MLSRRIAESPPVDNPHQSGYNREKGAAGKRLAPIKAFEVTAFIWTDGGYFFLLPRICSIFQSTFPLWATAQGIPYNHGLVVPLRFTARLCDLPPFRGKT